MLVIFGFQLLEQTLGYITAPDEVADVRLQLSPTP
jgi:hypothetical protein